MNRLVLALVLGLSLTGCGIIGGSQPTATVPPPTSAPAATSPSPSPKPAAPAASPSPAAAAQPTPTAQTPVETVYVANTDGIGVFIRRTPTMADRVRAYPDSTALQIIGEDVFGDGQRWHHVKAPDGLEGYVPVIYTVDTPP
jgi:hypothetical protein